MRKVKCLLCCFSPLVKDRSGHRISYPYCVDADQVSLNRTVNTLTKCYQSLANGFLSKSFRNIGSRDVINVVKEQAVDQGCSVGEKPVPAEAEVPPDRLGKSFAVACFVVTCVRILIFVVILIAVAVIEECSKCFDESLFLRFGLESSLFSYVGLATINRFVFAP